MSEDKIPKYEPNRRHIREILLFCYNLKKTPAAAHRMLEEAYGQGCADKSMCRSWFRRFRVGNYDVEGYERCGRPKKPIKKPPAAAPPPEQEQQQQQEQEQLEPEVKTTHQPPTLTDMGDYYIL